MLITSSLLLQSSVQRSNSQTITEKFSYLRYLLCIAVPSNAHSSHSLLSQLVHCDKIVLPFEAKLVLFKRFLCFLYVSIFNACAEMMRFNLFVHGIVMEQPYIFTLSFNASRFDLSRESHSKGMQ